MADIRLSRVALADFDSLVEYLVDVAGNPVAADYATRIQAAINRLQVFPGIGSPRPRLGPETRMLVVDPYLVFYDGDPKSELVQVLRILHSHRDITPELIASGRRP
jgi:plasmid stabilization system protein ParE